MNKAQAQVPVIITSLSSMVMYILFLPVFSPFIDLVATGQGEVVRLVIYVIPFAIFLFLFWRIYNSF